MPRAGFIWGADHRYDILFRNDGRLNSQGPYPFLSIAIGYGTYGLIKLPGQSQRFRTNFAKALLDVVIADIMFICKISIGNGSYDRYA